jgi:hypothetical protein
MDLMDLLPNDVVEIIRLGTGRRIITWVEAPTMRWGSGEMSVHVHHDGQGKICSPCAHSTGFAKIKFLHRPSSIEERDGYIALIT